MLRRFAVTLRNVPERDCNHGGCEGRINEEHPMPREMLDEPSAQHRAKRRGDCREARPCPDGLTPRLFVKGSADHCQTTGDKKCRTNPLNATRDYQLLYIRGKTASRRSDAEDSRSQNEHEP